MNFTEMGDQGVLEELGDRIRRGRLNRNVAQADLARAAGVSRTVLQRLEGGRGCTLENLVRILRALGVLGQLDAFLPDPGYSPIQLAKLHGAVRERASRYGRERR